MAGRFSSLLTGSWKRRPGFWLRAGVAGAGATAIATGAFIAGGSSHPTASHTSPQAAPATSHPMKLAAAPADNQYWMVASDGGIFSKPEGVTPFWGSEGYHRLNQPIVGMVATPDGRGYWLVARDGGIFTEGDAEFHGSLANTPITAPIVGIAATPDGHGYWIAGADGHVYNMGDAPDFGSEWPKHLNQPVVGIAATPDGGGYWLVATDGGIFTHGDAPYLGGEGWHHLNQPVVGIAASPDGKGYWLAAADGGIFTEGAVGFYGSQAAAPLNQPVVGIAATPTGRGYWMVASDGGIFSHGDANFGGSEGNVHLNQPVVGMAAVPELMSSTVSMSATAGTIVADGASTSTITSVVRDAGGNPIPGRTVALSVTTAGCGSLSPSRGVTDLNGAVVTTYTASTQVGSCSVRAADINAPAAANTIVIAQSVGAPVTVTASHTSDGNQTADSGHTGIPVSFTVTDAEGHPVPGVTVDLATTLPHGATAAASKVTDSSGVASSAVLDTWALDPNNPDTGVVTGTLHGTGVHGSTGTITIIPGAFAQLAQPAVASQTAGTAYAVTVNAEDAYGNPVNPSTSELTPSGTALATAPDTTHTGSATWDPAGFSGGTALLHVTSYKAGSVVLTITDTNPSITTTTAPYSVAATAPTGISATAPPSPASDNADDATAHGVTVTFVPTDQYLNPVPNTTVDMTVAPLSSHATVSPTSPVSDASGNATTKLYDSHAETSTVTGTVHGTSIHAPAPAITITAGALHTLAFSGTTTVPSAIPAMTAGSPATIYLNASDTYGNAVNPAASDIALSGTALTTQGGHSASSSVGAFSNGQSAVALTLYQAGTGRQLTASDSTATTGGTITGTGAFTVNPGALMQINLASLQFITTSLGASTLYFQDPNSGTATVNVTTFDAYGNAETGNSDTLTLGLAGSTAPNADGGTITGGSTPDGSGSVALTNGTASFTYTAPSSGTAPNAGYGTITVSDSHSPSATVTPATIAVVDTKVHTVTISFGGSTTYSADQAQSGLAVSATALDNSGTPIALGNVPIDFTIEGFNNVVTPATSTASTGATGGPAGITIHPTQVSTGDGIAALHGAPVPAGPLSTKSATISITPGSFAKLAISAVSPASPTAGKPYTATATATDAEGNAVQPAGGVTFTPGGTASSDSIGGHTDSYSVGTFTNGVATITGTAFKAESGVTLVVTSSATTGTPPAAITGSAPTFNVVPDVPATASVAYDTSSGTGAVADGGGWDYTTDHIGPGITVTVTITDQFTNRVPNAVIDLTTSLPHGHLSPAKVTTISASDATNGTATSTLSDTVAGTGEAGTVTATSEVGTATAPSVTAHVLPGALSSLTISNPTTQTAGVLYKMTVTAVDQFGNGISGTPSSVLGVNGTATSTALDGTTHAASAFEKTFFDPTTGNVVLDVTSYLAQTSGVVTVSSTTPAKSASTLAFTINPGATTQIAATTQNTTTYSSSTATLRPAAPNESDAFTFTFQDQWQNAAPTQADLIHVTLAGANGGADGGSLTGGGSSSGADAPGTTVAVDVRMGGQYSGFTYTAPASLNPTGSGTITWTDTTHPGITARPTSIAVKGSLVM